MRFNIRKVKGLLWLTCVVVLGLGGWTFWEIYQDKLGGRYEPRKSSQFRDIFELEQKDAEAPPPTTYYPEAARSTLWTARIDGSVKPVAPQPGAKDNEDKGPPKIVVPNLETVVNVTLIVWSEDPDGRFIALEYDADVPGGASVAARGATSGATATSKIVRLHLGEGEPLREPWDAAPYNGAVASISRQEVTFRWGEGEVTVRPQLGASGLASPVDEFDIATVADVAANVEVQDERQVLPDGSILMGRDDLELVRNDSRKILAEDIVAQSVTDAEHASSYILLKNVAPNSLAAKYGFKSGDRVISVNGIPMPSLTAATNWAKANPDLPTYVVVYERLGQKVTATIHVK